MNENLQEFCDWRGTRLRVDRQAGVIQGVKILGLQSRNGRVYLPEALAAAVALYEQAKVNVNHPKGDPRGPRDYQDRMGLIRNVVVRDGEGLFADFHFNPAHVLAEQLAWDAEHAPENVGFSHNVQARTARRGDQTVVEAITRVQSVDLVADPATTRGLFEADEGTAAAAVPPAVLLETATVADVVRQRPDLVEALGRETRQPYEALKSEVERLTALEAARAKRGPRPQSRDPLALAPAEPLETTAFVRAITR